ncbi:MAG: hypothetical protein RLZZ560_1006, partial [Cyanobacteriota bacterium]
MAAVHPAADLPDLPLRQQLVAVA